MPEPLRIGVQPAAELSRRARLLAALEQAYPVRFVQGTENVDGIVAFGPGVENAGVPSLTLLDDESPAHIQARVTLGSDERLARPLRSATLTDDCRHGGAEQSLEGDVLATVGGEPVWVRRGDVEVAALAPPELEEGEALRERLAPGRCLALLPLAHFLAALSADRRWQPPALRAAIVLDDPNLRWPSYGRVRYAELAREAADHSYHVSVAMVPLDAWLAHPRVTRLFRAAADRLSICIHGNDHSGPELGRPRSDAAADALAAEALRRMTRFERRTGLQVSRVMAPPHERVSEPAARALRSHGYHAICTTRPYPWLVEGLHANWLTRPADAGPLAGWESVDVVAGGLPVLLRSSFDHPREDLVLRAFLGQPLILYGHHGDVDRLAEAAADVNRLGEVRWCSLEQIARTSVETRRTADTLHVRPRASRVRVQVPEGVRRVATDLSALGLPADAPLRLNGATPSPAAPGTADVIGPGIVELEAGTPPRSPAAPRPAAAPRRLWPLARRLASEGRDRAAVFS